MILPSWISFKNTQIVTGLCYHKNMKTVFLDRDGTMIVDPPDATVETLEKIQLFPDTISSLKLLAENDFAVVIITNQTAIAEGRMSEQQFWTVHNEVLNRIGSSGINILKTYMNGEGPGPNATQWRKPGPKMLLQAAEDFDLELSEIYMVGDNQSDVQAAINAKCKGGIVVQTATNKTVISPEAVYSAPCLLDAVKYVIANS
jgi:histidinol-phosphate phosphatase family protein